MKQVVRIILAAAAVAALAVPAMAADKLIVKNAGGTADVFKVADDGKVFLPTSAFTGSNVVFQNAASINNMASMAAAPDGSLANQGVSLQVIPRGTGFNASIKSQISVFNTDLNADGINYEAVVLKAGGARYSINSVIGGTGVLRPIEFQIASSTKLAVATNGFIGVGTATPAVQLDVNAASIRIRTAQTPASTAACNAGEFSWDANFVYVCTASGVWKRAALGGY